MLLGNIFFVQAKKRKANSYFEQKELSIVKVHNRRSFCIESKFVKCGNYENTFSQI